MEKCELHNFAGCSVCTGFDEAERQRKAAEKAEAKEQARLRRNQRRAERRRELAGQRPARRRPPRKTRKPKKRPAKRTTAPRKRSGPAPRPDPVIDQGLMDVVVEACVQGTAWRSLEELKADRSNDAGRVRMVTAVMLDYYVGMSNRQIAKAVGYANAASVYSSIRYVKQQMDAGSDIVEDLTRANEACKGAIARYKADRTH